MLVKVKENRNQPQFRLTFLEFINVNDERLSIPAYFPKKGKQPEPGSEVEVMITNFVWNKDKEHNHFYDYDNPYCAFIQQPDETHHKAHFEGFSTDGSGCFTTSHITFLNHTIPSSKGLINTTIATPGLLHMALHNQDNVSGEEPGELVPGFGWFEKNPQNGRYRLAGVESLSSFTFFKKEYIRE